MTTKEVLQAALKLIETEDRWCRDRPRVIEHGEIVKRDAVAAVEDAAKIAGYTLESTTAEPFMALFKASGKQGITVLNDRDGHAAVVAVFKKAIAAL